MCAYLASKALEKGSAATHECTVTLRGRYMRFVICAWLSESKEVKNVELDLDLTKCSPEPKGAAPDRAEPAGGCINTGETPPNPAHRAARVCLSAGSCGTHSNYTRAHSTGVTPRQPRAAPNVFWAPTGEEPNAAELLLYALLVVRAYPRKADREEWLSYLLAEAKRALEARGGWEEPQTARWGRPNKVSAIHAVLRHAIDAALCDTAARDEIAAAMRAWHGAGEHFALIR